MMLLRTQQELERAAEKNHFTISHPQDFLNIDIPEDIEKPFEPVSFSINEKEVCYLTFNKNFRPVLRLNNTNVNKNEFEYFVTLINLIEMFVNSYETILSLNNCNNKKFN